MWTNRQFFLDSSWRAFRTFCQSLAGLLTVSNISSAFNAPWTDLVGASLLAALISFLQSVDRERVATAIVATTTPAEPQPAILPEPQATELPDAYAAPTEPEAENLRGPVVRTFGFISPPQTGCGESLR